MIRDFEREGEMAATRVIVRELAAPISERPRYRMHCFSERDAGAATKDVGIEVLGALQEQFGMSRTPFGDRREH